MPRATITLISLSLFCLTLSLPATADIFSLASEDVITSGDAAALPPMNSARVLRQRAVRIVLDNVASKLHAVLRFNLFDDVTLAVVCDRLNEGSDGSRICYGRVVGDEHSEVTMVVGEASLAATLSTTDRTYKVRPIDDNWHVVREIRPEGGETTLWAAAATDDERTVWTLTNQERADNGLPGLSLNGDLVESARAHSADMATQDYFDHTGLDGSSPGDRIAATGYEASSWGENIAAGYGTPQAVVEGWMNSPGHRANILGDNYCDIGVGYADGEGSTYGTYWTQNFGRQAGVSECPSVIDNTGDNSGESGGNSEGSSSSEGGCFLGMTLSFR